MVATKAFTHLMVSSEIGVLRRLHGMLEHDRITEREEFNDLMVAAFRHGKLDPRALADDLGYSASAVYRWVEGATAPHPSLWPRIVQWVMTAVESRIEEAEENSLEVAL